MSAPSSCCSPCQSVEIVDVPGTEGEPGTPGAAGADGVNAYTVLTANLTLPAVNAAEDLFVANNSWVIPGQIIVASDPSPGTDFATFRVVSKTGTTVINGTFLGASGDSAPGSVIGTGGGVSPGGAPSALSGALPTAFTDNSGGTPSNTLAAGVGVSTIALFISAAAIANGDLLTDYVPGYRFKILAFDARCADPVTTGAKASTLNLEIGAVNLTGGVIALAGLYAQGAAQAGTAVTANNVGTAADTISVEASATTAFIEGAFWLLIRIQNMDLADEVASMAAHINDLITALT